VKKLDSQLYKKYIEEVVPEMKKSFKVKNPYALPRLEKFVVNMGLKKAREDKTVLDEAQRDMALITGQKPVITKAKKAISNFGLKKGNPIGCRVTLRGKRMYEFLNKTLKIVVPRIRDFRGLKRSFDLFGNLTIGITDESIYPEIDIDKIKSPKGLSITVVTDKREKEKSRKIFELMGFPFAK
jgi:large subunit ribosomal protein L5